MPASATPDRNAPDLAISFVHSATAQTEYLRELTGLSGRLYPASEDVVWSARARELFEGLWLYCMETASESRHCSVNRIKAMATGLDCLKDEETFLAHVQARAVTAPLSHACTTRLQPFTRAPEKIRHSLLLSLTGPLDADLPSAAVANLPR